MIDTELTIPQAQRLCELEKEDGWTVIGWHKWGPLLRGPEGQLRWINPHGRMCVGPKQ